MGPTVLFDKSFLESLHVDESCWFDHFFLTNVCPSFYIETHGDIAKEAGERGSGEHLVRALAEKFPDWSGSPNVHHRTMLTGNLMGEDVPMRGQVVFPRGYQAIVGGNKMVIYPESDEAKAFHRWATYTFDGIAKALRSRATNPGLDEIRDVARKVAPRIEHAREELISVLTSLKETTGDSYILRLLEKANETERRSGQDFINVMTPRHGMTSDPSAMNGPAVPPHVSVQAEVMEIHLTGGFAKDLGAIAQQAAMHLGLKLKTRRSVHGGTKVFIGHGRSAAWRDLKDCGQCRPTGRRSLPTDSRRSSRARPTGGSTRTCASTRSTTFSSRRWARRRCSPVPGTHWTGGTPCIRSRLAACFGTASVRSSARG